MIKKILAASVSATLSTCLLSAPINIDSAKINLSSNEFAQIGQITTVENKTAKSDQKIRIPVTKGIIPESIDVYASNMKLDKTLLTQASSEPPMERVLKEFIGKDVQLAIESELTSSVGDAPHFIQDVKILHVENGYVFVQAQINATIARNSNADIFNPTPHKSRVIALNIEDYIDRFAFVYLPESAKKTPSTEIQVSGESMTANDVLLTSNYQTVDLDHITTSKVTFYGGDKLSVIQNLTLENESDLSFIDTTVFLDGKKVLDQADIPANSSLIKEVFRNSYTLPDPSEMVYEISAGDLFFKEGSKVVQPAPFIINLDYSPSGDIRLDGGAGFSISHSKENKTLLLQSNSSIEAKLNKPSESLTVSNENNFSTKIKMLWPDKFCHKSGDKTVFDLKSELNKEASEPILSAASENGFCEVLFTLLPSSLLTINLTENKD